MRGARGPFLRLLLAGIRSDAETEMRRGGVDVDALGARLMG